MDRAAEKERWAWLPSVMPHVAQLMIERRAEHGRAHIAECWRRGMAGEPGWFFAREGPVAIGTPWTQEQDLVLAEMTSYQATPTQALLIVRKPAPAMRDFKGREHGAN